ncbi:28894_t:CDS:2 [Racocetra persica]|uniref:28894_t:CDS:1 n=1 Tax=Racocetra persica TaxID=160502 RepID=A0ACA9L2J5_9GLOM|nr:28894_t:CDS:2 [Racocetra persica]
MQGMMQKMMQGISETYKDYMNHKISYYSEDYIDFALSSNMWIINNFPVTRCSMFESNDFEKESNFLPAIENIKDNIYEDSDLENELEEYECDNLDDELENSSLKEINTEQTFMSFEMLEQYLKRYST